MLQNAQVLAASGNGCIPPIPNHKQDLTRYSLCSRWNKMLHNAPAQLAPLLQHLFPGFEFDDALSQDTPEEQGPKRAVPVGPPELIP